MNTFLRYHRVPEKVSENVFVIQCVPKKWRQNSNHYNYGISYQN